MWHARSLDGLPTVTREVTEGLLLACYRKKETYSRSGAQGS